MTGFLLEKHLKMWYMCWYSTRDDKACDPCKLTICTNQRVVQYARVTWSNYIFQLITRTIFIDYMCQRESKRHQKRANMQMYIFAGLVTRILHLYVMTINQQKERHIRTSTVYQTPIHHAHNRIKGHPLPHKTQNTKHPNWNVFGFMCHHHRHANTPTRWFAQYVY